jgi:hypothetical protein
LGLRANGLGAAVLGEQGEYNSHEKRLHH